MRAVPSNPWARKPIATLLAEMHGGERLQRILGPLALTSLGIGATIGTGIYVLTGEVAHNYAGPSLMLSFLLAGVGCGFAALCYSELASMVPVAGSAYTYAYATLGELIAWIIGWDLILEYAIGSAAVANGWSNYFVALMQNVIGLRLDPRLLSPPWDYDYLQGRFLLKTVTLASGATAWPWFNLPAVVITALLTAVLVVGIRESAGFNAAMVILNIGIILTIVGVGAAYVDPRHWHPFLHKDKGWSGVAEGAARIFFAYIGFDSISTHAEEARNPQRDMAIGIFSALTVCTVLYVAVAAILTGMMPYTDIDVSAPLASAFGQRGLTKATTLITLGILTGLTSSLLIGNLSQAQILMAMARDGMLPEGFFAAVHPRFKTPWKSTILVGAVVALGGALAPLGFLADLVSIGTLFAFVIVSAAVLILRVTSPTIERPFRAPAIFLVAPASIVVNAALMCSLGRDNWLRLFAWLIVGLVIYFTYSRYHAKLGRDIERSRVMDLWHLMAIPGHELGKRTTVRVQVCGDTLSLAEAMAEEMAALIRDGLRDDRPVCAIVPVGPVDQYALLARTIAAEGLDCSRVTFINMDEYLGELDDWIDPGHPLSFRGFMDRAFYGLLPASARFLPENRIFPDPKDPGALVRQIAERGGVDVCFGGIGLNGHIAFNEPEAIGVEEFAARPARVLPIAPESRAHMAINLACALDLIPRRAVTVGMREILAARRLSLYANRPWQCGVVRQALHGPITPLCPASYLQLHADARLTMADFVAESKEIRLR